MKMQGIMGIGSWRSWPPAVGEQEMGFFSLEKRGDSRELGLACENLGDL